MGMLFLLIYSIIAVVALLAVLSWRATGHADSAFKLPPEQKYGMAWPIIMMVAIGLPLFASGMSCTVFWGYSALRIFLEKASTGGYGYSWEILGLSIAVPSALIGFFVCRYFWRRMRKCFER